MMRYLIAPARPGDRDDDFTHTVPGCGCARAFAGLASRRTTTIAIVADVPLDLDGLVELAAGVLIDAYQVPGDMADAARAETRSDVERIADLAARHPVGTTVRRSDLDET